VEAAGVGQISPAQSKQLIDSANVKSVMIVIIFRYWNNPVTKCFWRGPWILFRIFHSSQFLFQHSITLKCSLIFTSGRQGFQLLLSEHLRATSLREPSFDIYYHHRQGGRAANMPQPIPYALIVNLKSEESWPLQRNGTGVLECLTASQGSGANHCISGRRSYCADNALVLYCQRSENLWMIDLKELEGIPVCNGDQRCFQTEVWKPWATIRSRRKRTLKIRITLSQVLRSFTARPTKSFNVPLWIRILLPMSRSFSRRLRWESHFSIEQAGLFSGPVWFWSRWPCPDPKAGSSAGGSLFLGRNIWTPPYSGTLPTSALSVPHGILP